MAILNVVQPDEFAPSSFTTVGGKLKVAISVDDGNILEYKEDGLYAKASGSGTVPGRFTYQVDEKGEVIHKGIKFSLLNIDGAISGEISGVDINDITVDDVIYHVSDRTSSGPYSDDSKLLLSIPWAVEKAQRFIIRLMRSGVAEMWVVRVATPIRAVSLNGFQNITITIDEMANMGDLSSNAEELEIGDAGGGMYQANSLLRFPAIGKTATLAVSSSNTISLFSSDFDGNIDTSVDYIDQEQPYAKILNGVFVWDQNAHAAAWVSDNKRVYLARFDTTTIVPVITELGESINDRPWLEISHTSNGDVHVSEKATNNGVDINVWKVDINNTEVVPYFKESIRDETATFEGEHLCGNKLVAFESPVGGSGLRFRAVSVETNESIVSSEVPHFVFADCLFANLTGNTFVVINKLFAEDTWESIGTRVLMVTINETEVIVKDTGVLPLLNAKTLVIGSLSAGVDGDGSNVVNFYADEGGVSYIFRITDLNGEIGLSRQQVTSEMIQGAGIALQDGLPAVVFISSNTAYIQHDFKLSSFKTFPLTMEKYDNSPKPVAFTATWKRDNGHILLNGQIAKHVHRRLDLLPSGS